MIQKHKPFIIIDSKDTDNRLSIYDNGLVYGKNKGQLLGKLNNKATLDIKQVINENIYMFKKLVYYNEALNPYILRIRDDSRKHRPIKIVGWSQFHRINRVISNKRNWEYFNKKSCI